MDRSYRWRVNPFVSRATHESGSPRQVVQSRRSRLSWTLRTVGGRSPADLPVPLANQVAHISPAAAFHILASPDLADRSRTAEHAMISSRGAASTRPEATSSGESGRNVENPPEGASMHTHSFLG